MNPLPDTPLRLSSDIRQLIEAANANGGPDNITAIIVQLETLS